MSQLRSGRGAKAGAGGRSGGTRARAAQQQRGRGVYVQQAKNDIFVILLGVALGAMVLGCLFLVLKLGMYGFATGGPGA